MIGKVSCIRKRVQNHKYSSTILICYSWTFSAIFLRKNKNNLFVSLEGWLMAYYVYILRCKDGSYYTGHAKDPQKRYELHKKGQGAQYTRSHEPEKLVYLEAFETRGDAMRRERKIKKMSHNRKKQLIIKNKLSL
jgi:putative endonuclease